MTPLYRLFGVTLETDFPFANPLVAGTGTADLRFVCSDSHVDADQRPDAPVYESPYRTDSGESALSMYCLDGCDLLHFGNVADFYVWSDHINCHACASSSPALIEIQFLGVVLAFWLERRGLAALHASAVVAGGQAVAFLSINQGGKSALAAALMQRGHPLLTDDILALEQRREGFVAYPGYPAMRMWPDEAQALLGHYRDLDIVHPALEKRRVPVGSSGLGAFAPGPCPLRCIYLPERSEQPGIRISRVLPSAAVVELLRHLFVRRMLEALGMHIQRLDFFARLVKQIPVRRLVYPSGFDSLPAVCDAILADLDDHRS